MEFYKNNTFYKEVLVVLTIEQLNFILIVKLEKKSSKIEFKEEGVYMEDGKPKKITIREVANLSGVAIGTVSHVMNGTAAISELTSQKVWDAVEELQYTPNYIAQLLRKKHSKIIGCLVPELNNPFYSGILSIFIECAATEGYKVLLLDYQNNSKKELEELQQMVDQKVDAVVLFHGFDDVEMLKKLKEQIPVILIGREEPLLQIPSIRFENKDVMEQLIRQLHCMGYQKIAFLTESLQFQDLKDRYHCFLEAMYHCGHHHPEKYLLELNTTTKNTFETSYQFCKNLLISHLKKDLPEAFITSSDMVAIGAMHAIQQAGYQIPDDFGIVGCENLSMCSYISPTLTTIEQNKLDLGVQAWNMVLHALNNEQTPPVVLQSKLIFRESC
ncbi:LacI family DNA-binding transcriptional regulator [Massilioclostridium coli]|uniref:LacI family DNA-binding transcriptional regulator n=1 Tax=Massilioclostridium coli TaxID=1870991 RepID=UPI0022E967B5|nr:LacI family DNA-binding transcriptional regulator [Massilioclostridium coli]